jgi:trans-2,3-dihydro-3-hydroxyanthranilate isomerase
MQRRFVTVDVFTQTRFAGNPLAVVLDAEGLTPPQMQIIAAEFNLSETTFVLPPNNPANTAQVRIFTPRAEMPFAGHPNVGTAFALARFGESYGVPISGDVLRFEEIAGLVPVTLLRDNDAIVGARLAAPQPFSRGTDIDVSLIARAHGLSEADIETSRHAPCIASCGTPFVLAELKTREALLRAQAQTDVFMREVSTLPVTSLMIYTQVQEQYLDVRARMFSPHHNIAEDPATGSANVALVGLLASLRPERDLVLTKTIAQGVEMSRPSVLHAEAIKVNGGVAETFIGGHCVAMMSGVMDV